jgi:16S rRNA (uracil1498-N3)-methyltransferase
MHRFYAAPDPCAGGSLILKDREAHHALHVLRVQKGDRVAVLDGMGNEFICEVEACFRDRIELKVVQKNFIPPLPYRITLLQALPKGKIIESIIQKATELGVYRIIPLITERTTSRPGDESAANKTSKWQQIAVEAVKQCGSPWLPKIESPVHPGEFLARGQTYDLSLVGSLQPGSRHAGDYFRAFREKENRPPQTVCVWVGPEGDFTPEELSEIISGGAHPITLGRLVLRTETAAISCLAILNYELQSTA